MFFNLIKIFILILTLTALNLKADDKIGFGYGSGHLEHESFNAKSMNQHLIWLAYEVAPNSYQTPYYAWSWVFQTSLSQSSASVNYIANQFVHLRSTSPLMVIGPKLRMSFGSFEFLNLYFNPMFGYRINNNHYNFETKEPFLENRYFESQHRGWVSQSKVGSEIKLSNNLSLDMAFTYSQSRLQEKKHSQGSIDYKQNSSTPRLNLNSNPSPQDVSAFLPKKYKQNELVYSLGISMQI